MRIDVQFGVKEKLTGKNLVETIVRESECKVDLREHEGRLVSASIQFTGLAANIPSMKNSKIPGRNFINNDYKCHLQAMDRLYAEAAGDSSLNFGEQDVSMMVLFACRSRSFDTDNATTTLKDWLEPRTKKVGKRFKVDRGWGIGLVQDDKRVYPYAVHARMLFLDSSTTRILLCPFDKVKAKATQFIESHGG